jgi:glucose-6-phosphate 1-dehydrogenase
MDKTYNRTTPADALVIFGVTGDLAHKMIFPALYAMAKRGALAARVKRAGKGFVGDQHELYSSMSNRERGRPMNAC